MYVIANFWVNDVHEEYIRMSDPVLMYVNRYAYISAWGHKVSYMAAEATVNMRCIDPIFHPTGWSMLGIYLLTHYQRYPSTPRHDTARHCENTNNGESR